MIQKIPPNRWSEEWTGRGIIRKLDGREVDEKTFRDTLAHFNLEPKTPVLKTLYSIRPLEWKIVKHPWKGLCLRAETGLGCYEIQSRAYRLDMMEDIQRETATKSGNHIRPHWFFEDGDERNSDYPHEQATVAECKSECSKHWLARLSIALEPA